MNNWKEKIVPLLWLYGCFLLIGVQVGFWLRGGK